VATKRRLGSWVVIGVFLTSGVLHLINPEAFLWLMPPFLPYPLELVYASGVAELVAALGLLFRYRWALFFTVLVLLAVWPANWWFAIDVLGSGDLWLAIAAWLRLPLQIPLILWAWRSPQRTKEGVDEA
jgi:uncharacterized membrane protein